MDAIVEDHDPSEAINIGKLVGDVGGVGRDLRGKISQASLIQERIIYIRI